MLLERSGFAAAEQWTERSWRGELLGEGRTILIARAQHPVGVISIKTVGELADLHRLVVELRSRRRGIGTDLVRAGLEVVRQLGARQNYYGPMQHALILKLYDLQAWPDRIAITTEEV